MTTTFETVGVVAIGRPALLFGVKNHPNPQIRGGCVITSTVKGVSFKDGIPVVVRTQNTVYYRESKQ